MRFELVTVAIRPDGCFSALLHEGRPFAVTCERTFEDGRPVIQAGIHKCRKTWFVRGQHDTYEIETTGHSRVLFHRGNVEQDSIACILVAKAFTVMNGQCAIRDSVPGFREFMEACAGVEEFDLTVSGR